MKRPYLVRWRDIEGPTPILAATNSSARLLAVKHRFGVSVRHNFRYATALVSKHIESCREWGGPAEKCVVVR